MIRNMSDGFSEISVYKTMNIMKISFLTMSVQMRTTLSSIRLGLIKNLS